MVTETTKIGGIGERVENLNRAWVYRIGVRGRVIGILFRVYDVDAESLREAIRIVRGLPGNRPASHCLILMGNPRRN